jgi:hypothetical protein
MAAHIHKTKIAKIKTQLMRYMTHEIFLYSKCDTWLMRYFLYSKCDTWSTWDTICTIHAFIRHDKNLKESGSYYHWSCIGSWSRCLHFRSIFHIVMTILIFCSLGPNFQLPSYANGCFNRFSFSCDPWIHLVMFNASNFLSSFHSPVDSCYMFMEVENC